MLGSVAFACQSTVTLYSKPTTVAAGGTVKVTGNKYNNSFNPVEIRLDSRTGPVLATAKPVGGVINADVTIPANTPGGYHVMIATQYNNAGTPCTGCPGRTTIKVTPASTAAEIGGLRLPVHPLAILAFGLASLGIACWQYRRRASTTA